MSPSSPVSSSSSSSSSSFSSSSASPPVAPPPTVSVVVRSMSVDDDLWGSEPSSPTQDSTTPNAAASNTDQDGMDHDTLINSNSSSSIHEAGSVAGSEVQDFAKPAFSYASLIAQAIVSSPQKKMTLSAIYSWVIAAYPYYNLKDLGWQVRPFFFFFPFFSFSFFFFPGKKMDFSHTEPLSLHTVEVTLT